MIGHGFRTVDPGLVAGELKRIALRAIAGRRFAGIQINDLWVRCLMGPRRTRPGRLRLVPVFDAIYIAPDYSWRCGKFDAIKFTGGYRAMERWLKARRKDIACAQ